MSLVKDSVTPGNPKYNEKAARAKLMHSGPSGQDGTSGGPRRTARGTRMATRR
jgi:hypothetical protein